MDTLQELKACLLAVRSYPSEIRLDSGTRITDLRKFIHSHLAVLEAHPGERKKLMYYQRLVKLKEAIERDGTRVHPAL